MQLAPPTSRIDFVDRLPDGGRVAAPAGSVAVQMIGGGGPRRRDDGEVKRAAAAAVATGTTTPPFLSEVQRSFGHHDVGGARVHSGPTAVAGARAIGAEALTLGEDVVLPPNPSLKMVAHEFAHVVQQRGGVDVPGGVGRPGDAYERHADAVAERAVSGRSAVDLLDGVAGGPGGAREAGAAVQCFTVIDADPPIKLSTQKKLALFDKQVLYADAALVGTANEKLEAAGAYIELTVSSSDTVSVSGSGQLGRVGIKWAADRAPDSGFMSNLGRRNEATQGYVSFADCHRTAQTVMGSQSQGISNTEEVVLTPNYLSDLATEELEIESSAKSRGKNLQGAHANRGMYAFFNKALPTFSTFLKVYNAVKYDAIIKAIDAIGLSTLDKFDKTAYGKCSGVYRSIVADSILSRLFANKFGVNEALVPQVGHAISQINDEYERSQTQDRDLWNFHWAGVVLVEDDDYVTLENLSVENEDTINAKWYFAMYGRGAQSFHTTNKSDQHVGTMPLTLGFRSNNG